MRDDHAAVSFCRVARVPSSMSFLLEARERTGEPHPVMMVVEEEEAEERERMKKGEEMGERIASCGTGGSPQGVGGGRKEGMVVV